MEYASATLRNDKEVVLAAVKGYYRAFEHASDSLQKDKGVILAAVGQSKAALDYVIDVLKKNKLSAIEIKELMETAGVAIKQPTRSRSQKVAEEE